MSPVHLPHHFQQGSYLWIAIYRPLLKVKHSNLQRSRAALRNALREMATSNESPVILICRTYCTYYGTKHIRRTLRIYTYSITRMAFTYVRIRERGVILGYMYTISMGQNRCAGDNCTNYCIIGREYCNL